MQAVASFVGGTVGVILITLLAPLFSQLARNFGPPEYFLLAMMGMLCLVVMVGSDWRYGVISGLIGFALGTVGIDLETGQQRFTFGSPQLIGGIDFIPIAIGLFGLGELFYAFYEGRHASGSGGIVEYHQERRFWPELRDGSRRGSRSSRLAPRLRGRVIPGAGATIASLMAYSVEKSAARSPSGSARAQWPGWSDRKPPTTPPPRAPWCRC